MSIARVDRLILIAAADERRAVLGALQDAGFVHIDGLVEAARRAARTGEAGGERARPALRYLASAPRVRTQAQADPQFDVSAFVEAVLANQDARRAARDARDAVAHRIDQVAPWGDFNLPGAPEDIGGRLWFYILPARALAALRGLTTPWSVVHQADGKAYIAVVSDEEPPADAFPAPRMHVGDRPLRALVAERDRLDLLLDDLDLQREGLTRRMGLLAQNLALAEDRGLLAIAEDLAQSHGEIVVLSGWVAHDRAAEAAALAEAMGVAAIIAPPAKSDTPPTLLRPPSAFAAGADLTRLYQLPGARDWDPSTVVFFSFAVFFALILSDAGYGLMLLAAGLLVWPRLGSAAGRGWRALWLTAAGLSVAWGAAVGSWFGAAPPGPAAALHVIDMSDYDAMMRLCVAIGAGHVAAANLGAAWAARGTWGALFGVGWALATLSGLAAFLFEPMRAPAIAAGGIAAVLIAIGSGGVFSALAALANVTKAFADVLSYLRLFALGLASASLAVAFNDLAAQAREGLGSFGVLAQAITLLVGHSLNFVLSIAGGVVHGLRLNLIEFLSWGLKEEGRAFTPFARRAEGR
jgi:V/A-type H+-transporting ATPase subunit I